MGLYKTGNNLVLRLPAQGPKGMPEVPAKLPKGKAQAVMASIRKQVTAKASRSAAAASNDMSLLEAVERLWKERWASQKSGFRSRNRLVNLAEAWVRTPG